MDVPATCRAAVYDPDHGPKLDIREFSLRPPNTGEILVRITLSAICGSDRHTVHGRRLQVANIDLQRITTHILHLIGLHNYTPADLQTALTFLTDFGHQFAFDRVVAQTFPLDEINQALNVSSTRQDWLRAAIAP